MTSRSYHCSCVFSHHLDRRRLQRLRTTNSSSSSSSSSRRLNRSFVRKTTTNSSSEESSSEEQPSSWKVVSESPFSNSSSTTTNNSTTNDDTLEDSSLASEQPSRLRIEAESSSSSTRTTEENNVGEEKVGGIPINSSRRATKMLFTCNKCGTFLSFSQQSFSFSLFFIHNYYIIRFWPVVLLSLFLWKPNNNALKHINNRNANRAKGKQSKLNHRDDLGPVREPVVYGLAQNSR